MKTYPYCKEPVHPEAVVCPHCGCSIFAAELQEKVNQNTEKTFRIFIPLMVILAIIYITG